MNQETKTVFVGLSGGVDSSVAALRLQRKGYYVVGVFIKVWQPDWLECDWEAERLDAMRVAAKLQIPFLTCDAEQAYKTGVADYFISEYKAGRTPNPDVMCNKHVKFGAFMEFAKAHGADYIATGHYAQVKQNGDIFELHRGVDLGKDQTYFLWTLTQGELRQTLLPVGKSNKNVIRKEAKAAGLLTAKKPDSQGICFLGHIDIPEFLSHYVELKEGKVLNAKNEVIGTHQGALVYTTGQRHGFRLHNSKVDQTPHYVIARDMEQNTITVSKDKPESKTETIITLDTVNMISEPAVVLKELTMQTRYRQTPVHCQVEKIESDRLIIKSLEGGDCVSSGQSCVLYDDSKCIGGGIIR